MGPCLALSYVQGLGGLRKPGSNNMTRLVIFPHWERGLELDMEHDTGFALFVPSALVMLQSFLN